MTQREKLEALTGEKMPEPTKQEYHREQLEGTPFWMIQNKEGWHLIMGKYRINNAPFETSVDLLTWMKTEQWNITLSIIIAVTTDLLNKQNQN